MKDRLASLLSEAEGLVNNDLPTVEQIADYLIEHGVIVTPCKVGDIVQYKGCCGVCRVSAIHFYAEGEGQISITTGKMTVTETFSQFAERCRVLTEAK